MLKRVGQEREHGDGCSDGGGLRAGADRKHGTTSPVKSCEEGTVKKARALGDGMHGKMNVNEQRPIEECFERIKKPPIKVEWVGRINRDTQHMNMRSRPVAKQIHTRKGQALFGATPPLEVADAAVSNGHWRQTQGVDTGRAHMNARTSSDTVVELCDGRDKKKKYQETSTSAGSS